MKDHLFVLGAREEHAVKSVAVRPANLILLAFEGPLENESCLVMAPKEYIVAPEQTAAATDTPVHGSRELLSEQVQSLQVSFVLFGLRNQWRFVQHKELFNVLGLFFLLAFKIELVEEPPERDRLARRKPGMFEAD